MFGVEEIADPKPFHQSVSAKNNRFFVTCFNVSTAFAQEYKFPKSRGGGEFTIKYLEAAFNEKSCSGEFFFEFDEYVWEHKLVESLELRGACQVMCVTFNNNDKNESAANAIIRVLDNQKKTGLAYQRGEIPSALLAKVQAKQEAARNLSSTKEDDAKIALATQESLKLNYAKLETIDNNVQSQGVKLDGIQHGVCQVIPDKQKEIDSLKEALARKTKLCDSMEGRVASGTRRINDLTFRVAELLEEQKMLREKNQAFVNEKAKMMQDMSALTSQLNLSQYLQILIDKNLQTSEVLHKSLTAITLAEERACKRARENDD